MKTRKELGSFLSYLVGFLVSLTLTLLAFYLVTLHVDSGHIFIDHGILTGLILGLAFVQLFVQLILFLHIGMEDKPYWNLMMILVTAGAIFILVAGSVWIMNHLNYNMSPEQVRTYIQQQEFGGI